MKKLIGLAVMLLSIVSTNVLAALQQEDIDQFILKTPEILGVIKQQQKEPGNEMSKADSRALRKSMFEGTMYSTMASLLIDKPMMPKLNRISQEAGYKNFIDYAKVADRISAIIMSAQWVAKTAVGKNEKKIDNLYEHINSESISASEKSKLTQQLQKMYQKLGVQGEVEAVVISHYDELATALKMKR